MNLFRTNSIPKPGKNNSSNSSSNSSSTGSRSSSNNNPTVGDFNSSSSSSSSSGGGGSNRSGYIHTTTATYNDSDNSKPIQNKERAVIQTAVIYSDGRIYSNESSIDLAVSAHEVIESDVDSFLIGLHHKFDSSASSTHPSFAGNNHSSDENGYNDNYNNNSTNNKSNNTNQDNSRYNPNVSNNNNSIRPPSTLRDQGTIISNNNSVNPASGMVGSTTSPSFVISAANQGDFGGERRTPGVDNSVVVNNVPVAITGRPRQYDPVDKIEVKDRVVVNKLADSGGSRVNHSSHERKYAFDDYERSILIDPNRHLPPAQRENELQDPTGMSETSAEGAIVPFEVAAVGAKIKNMHKVGGERVKEMDHFVSRVEVPVLRYQLADGGDTRLTEIGKMVQLRTKNFNLENSVKIATGAASPSVSVESVYIDKDGKIPDIIINYSKLFFDLIENVCYILDFDFSKIRFFYMRTVRCNEFVCFREQSLIWVNVLLFQQGKNCDIKGDDIALPIQILPNRLKELLVYWITRISSVAEADPKVPRGLYNNNIWNRLQTHLSKQQPTSHSSPIFPLTSPPPPSSSSFSSLFPTPSSTNLPNANVSQSKPIPSSVQYASPTTHVSNSNDDSSNKINRSFNDSGSPKVDSKPVVVPKTAPPDSEMMIHQASIESLREIFPSLSPAALLSNLKQNNYDLSITIENILQNM